MPIQSRHQPEAIYILFFECASLKIVNSECPQKCPRYTYMCTQQRYLCVFVLRLKFATLNHSRLCGFEDVTFATHFPPAFRHNVRAPSTQPRTFPSHPDSNALFLSRPTNRFPPLCPTRDTQYHTLSTKTNAYK